MNANDWVQPGLSVRDYIAIEAMKGYMIGTDFKKVCTVKDIAYASYKMADAMIEQSEKHDGK